MTADNAGSFDPTARAFDRFAEDFDRFAELVGGPLNAYLDGVIPPGGSGRAVDLGCGSGHHAARLAPRYGEVLAVDVSAPMLALARARRKHPNVTYQQRDLRTIHPETDGRFDLVLSAYALHHLDDLDETLEGIRRLLAPGGRVVLVDNVAARPAVPRWWFRTEAVRLFAADLAGRRRPLREALELYRLNTNPAWLDHLTNDRFLHPDEFNRRTSRVFPGARYTALYRAQALCWDAPARRAARPGASRPPCPAPGQGAPLQPSLGATNEHGAAQPRPGHGAATAPAPRPDHAHHGRMAAASASSTSVRPRNHVPPSTRSLIDVEAWIAGMTGSAV